MIQISIVVAVYNVEKYLKECLDSLISQKVNELEIIIVDDGSTDSSPHICDLYGELDNRVKVIHQKNQGVSVARNIGISASTGKWILFVDGDDFIDRKLSEILMQTICSVETDMIIFDYFAVSHCGIKKCQTLSFDGGDITEKREIFQKKIISQYYNGTDSNTIVSSGTVWCKCVRTEVLTKNNLNFVPGLVRAQDTVFWLNVSEKVKDIYYIKQNLYFYRISVGSICSGKKYIADCEKVFGKLIEEYSLFINKYHNTVSYKKALNLRIIQIMMWHIDHDIFNELNKSDIKKRRNRLKNLSESKLYNSAIKCVESYFLPQRIRVMHLFVKYHMYFLYYFVYKSYNSLSNLKSLYFRD